MGFCSKCGEELPENAYFCPKCGVRTSKGKEANIPIPRENLGDVFSDVGEEMGKAFSIASREIEKAFKTAKEEIEKAISRAYIVCPHCGNRNHVDALFCQKCGKELK